MFNHGDNCTVIDPIGPVPKFGTRTTYIGRGPGGEHLVACTDRGAFRVAEQHVRMCPAAKSSVGESAIWVRGVRAGHDGGK